MNQSTNTSSGAEDLIKEFKELASAGKGTLLFYIFGFFALLTLLMGTKFGHKIWEFLEELLDDASEFFKKAKVWYAEFLQKYHTLRLILRWLFIVLFLCLIISLLLKWFTVAKIIYCILALPWLILGITLMQLPTKRLGSSLISAIASIFFLLVFMPYIYSFLGGAVAGLVFAIFIFASLSALAQSRPFKWGALSTLLYLVLIAVLISSFWQQDWLGVKSLVIAKSKAAEIATLDKAKKQEWDNYVNGLNSQQDCLECTVISDNDLSSVQIYDLQSDSFVVKTNVTIVNKTAVLLRQGTEKPFPSKNFPVGHALFIITADGKISGYIKYENILWPDGKTGSQRQKRYTKTLPTVVYDCSQPLIRVCTITAGTQIQITPALISKSIVWDPSVNDDGEVFTLAGTKRLPGSCKRPGKFVSNSINIASLIIYIPGFGWQECSGIQTWTIPADGEILVAINDSYYPDNTGKVELSLTLSYYI